MAEQGLDMKVVQYIMGHANIGVKPVKSRKTGTSQFFHKIISTQGLTVLIMRAIVHIEQRKGMQKIHPGLTKTCSLPDVPRYRCDIRKVRKLYCENQKGEMTYVDAQCIWREFI